MKSGNLQSKVPNPTRNRQMRSRMLRSVKDRLLFYCLRMEHWEEYLWQNVYLHLNL